MSTGALDILPITGVISFMPPVLFRSPRPQSKVKPNAHAVTVMFVPHTGDKARRLKLPIWAFQLSIVVVLALAGVLTWLGNDYLKLRSNTAELARLQCENKEQAEQIEALAQEAVDVKERLIEIDDLDMQVRQMLGLPIRESNELSMRSSQMVSRGGPAIPLTPDDIHNTFRGAMRNSEHVQETLEQLKEDIAKEQRRLAHLPTGWPVRGTITSKFGSRRSPFGRGAEFHGGLDISAPNGTAIKATADGVVTFSGWYSGYGYMVVIEHGYGYTTAYGHNSKLNVSVGQNVKRGDTIAYVGSTGRSTGPHLH